MDRCLSIVSLLVLLGTAAFAQDPETIEGTLEIANNMFVIVSDQTLSAGSEIDDSIAKSRRVMLAGYSTEEAETINKLTGLRAVSYTHLTLPTKA